MEKRKAILLGASGLIGLEILSLLINKYQLCHLLMSCSHLCREVPGLCDNAVELCIHHVAIHYLLIDSDYDFPSHIHLLN